MYETTLGDRDNGVVLLEYNIWGKQHRIMKRATQRSIYLQILLFSANGVYTLLTDKTMELMIFATGHVYKKDMLSSVSCNTWTEKRIKYSQCALGFSTPMATLLYIIGRITRSQEAIAISIVLVGISLVMFGVVIYKIFLSQW